MSGPIATTIRAIEDRIGDERYWVKGSFLVPIGHGHAAHCLVGAIGQVAKGGERMVVQEFLEDIAHSWTNGQRYVLTFNDDPATTHADVMLFLATALDVAESEGL